jgi:hypothetical protein
MRLLLSLLLLFAALSAWSQGVIPPQSDDGFRAVRPDVLVYVEGHAAAGEIVQISMVNPDYPAETLKNQVEDLCKRLNSPARGLQVYTYTMGSNSKLKFLQASFATTGMTDGEGNANLTPLLQALAGVPGPFTIKGVEVFYNGFDPPIKGPKNFTSPAVVITGRRDSSPPQVEYSIQLQSQNASEIQVETKPPTAEPTINQPPVEKSNRVMLWCLILLAGLAGGSLVYFLLIKRLSGSSSTSVLRKP